MIKLIVALVASTVLLSACIPDILNTQPEVRGLEGAAAVQTLADPANGTQVTLRPNGKLNLKLESNPTTGYYWFVVDIDASRLDQLSEAYFADPAPEGMVGSGGHQLFEFQALTTGRAKLKLAYQRSPRDVIDTVTLKIKVVE